MQIAERFEQLYLLKGKEYEIYKSGLPLSAVENVDSLCRTFERSPKDVRLEIISRVSPEISFLFLRFSEKMALSGVRRNDEQAIVRGLEALAIENCKLDWRENTLALALLYHSAAKIGVDAEKLVRFAAALAVKPAIDKLFTPFLARPRENRELSEFGMKEATGPDGEVVFTSLSK